jgi:hypothetical protein
MSGESNQSLQSLAALKGVAVTYRRGAGIRIPLTAIPAKTIVEGTDAAGTIMVTRMRDWLVQADDLAGSGSLLVPEEGDLVEHVTDRATVTYQVTRPAIDLPPYREIGDDGDWLRIHTQKVS